MKILKYGTLYVVSCSTCGAKLEASRDDIEKGLSYYVKCPLCKSTIIVPKEWAEGNEE